VSKSGKISWGDVSTVREREEKCIAGNLKESDYMERLGINGKTNIPIDLKDKVLECLGVD